MIHFKNCHCSFLKRNSEKSRGLHLGHIPQYCHVLSNNRDKMGQFRKHDPGSLMGNQQILVKEILY